MDKDFHACGLVEGGKVTYDDPVSLNFWLSLFNGKKLEVVFRIARNRRSNQQNRAWWGLMVPAFAKCYGTDDLEEAHLVLCRQIHYEIKPDKNGKLHRHRKETHNLPTDEFSELWEKGCRFMAMEYGCVVPDPKPELARI